MILVDVRTGCQYIGRVTPGDLKPLLDEQGKPICNRPPVNDAGNRKSGT